MEINTNAKTGEGKEPYYHHHCTPYYTIGFIIFYNNLVNAAYKICRGAKEDGNYHSFSNKRIHSLVPNCLIWFLLPAHYILHKTDVLLFSYICSHTITGTHFYTYYLFPHCPYSLYISTGCIRSYLLYVTA